jgi:hypothetical protein
MGYSRLEHTHSLKPVLYTLFSSFTDTKNSTTDWGGNLHEMSPSWVFYPTLLLVGGYFFVCIMLIIYIIKRFKGFNALFGLLVFGLASLSFFVAFFDAGPFCSSAGMGVTFLSIYLLFGYVHKKEFSIKWVLILMFLPLIVLETFNLFTYFVANVRATYFESHLIVSTFGLISAFLYTFSHQFKYHRILLLVLVFLLAVNLFSFKPFAWIQRSVKGDNVYMLFPIYSAPKEDTIEKITAVPHITNLETVAEYGKVLVIKADVEKSGLTTTYLAEKVIDKKLTPMSSNLIFVFADPKQKWNFTTYLPSDQINESQFLELIMMELEPFDISSVKRMDGLVEVKYTSPAGLDWRHFITILNKKMSVSYIIISRDPHVISSGKLAKDFLFGIIPITSAQIKIHELTV